MNVWNSRPQKVVEAKKLYDFRKKLDIAPGAKGIKGCGRKPEHPEETHTDTGRMCNLHTDSRPRQELNLGPWCYEAAVLATVSPKLCQGWASTAWE